MTPDMRKAELRAARAIARAVAEDVAVAIRTSIEDAQRRGQPFESFAKTFKKALAAKGWWGRKDQIDPKTGLPLDTPNKIPHRVALVIQTNTQTARAAGVWARIQRQKIKLPLLRYTHGDPERDRPAHEPYWHAPALTLPVDHPLLRIMFNPNGYGCTCHWVQLADGEISPITPEVIKVTARDGREYETVKGIAPEFAYNPGVDRLEGLRRAQILRRK